MRPLLVTLAMAALAAGCTHPRADQGGSADRRSPAGPGLATASAPGPSLSLLQPRAVQHASVLPDGRVLLTGGCTAAGCEDAERGRRSELFDPSTRTFTAGPVMKSARLSDTATVLPDGRVLIAGGYPGEGHPPTALAESYEPRTNRFVALGPMLTARAEHSASLLPDGRVVLCGGFGAGRAALRSCEFFDPATGHFSAGPPLSSVRGAHVAVSVAGKVVLLGGTVTGTALATTDVLAGGSWRPGPRMTVPRLKHGAAVLPDGRILVVGGAQNSEGRVRLRSTEFIDLVAGRAVPGPRLSEGQYKLDGAVVGLADGRIAIAGGRSLEVYDPADSQLHLVGPAGLPRLSFRTASAVGPDQVLLVGGYDDSITPTAAASVLNARS